MKAKANLVLGFLLLTVVSLWISLRLYPVAHPFGGLDLVLQPDSIRSRAAEVFRGLGISTEGLKVTEDLGRRNELLRRVYETHGISEGNRLLRRGVPGYTWTVTWQNPKNINVVIGSSSDSREGTQQVLQALAGEVKVELGVQGELLGLSSRLADSVALPFLPLDSARDTAASFLRHFFPAAVPGSSSGFIPAGHRLQEFSGRTDYEFRWAGRDTVLGDSLHATVKVSGDRVSAFTLDRSIPESYRGLVKSVYREIALSVFFVVVIVAMVVVGLRRIRAYEIGWRLGTVLGIFGGIAFGVELFFSLPPGLDVRMLVSVVLGPLAYGIGLMLAWSVAEATGRESWKEKFISLDLLTKGHLFHSRVGAAIVRGIGFGLLANAIWLLLTWGAEQVITLSSSFEGGIPLKQVSSLSPGLFLLSHTLYSALFTVAVLVLFCLSLLRRPIASSALLVAAGALIIGVAARDLLRPELAGIAVESLTAAVIVWVFYRFDVLTSYVALVALAVFSSLGVLLLAGDSWFVNSGNVVLGLFGVAFAAGVVGIFTRDSLLDLDAIAPVFVKHITERERLQGELEVAREVQMSLLPKADPWVEGLQIASRCVPAQEVGGDYYDYVNFDPSKFGVVVGDVSGKGTQAAFYMTLAKGFLKAVTRMSGSPSRALTEANALFYENVDRGNFITVVYGEFDLRSRTLTLARAGHNPVIMKAAGREAAEFLQPGGLALGLEPGEVFAKTIRESTVPALPGALFVFYTDGFTEAMNRAGEQFGEQRLLALVGRLQSAPAREIVDGVLTEVRAFAGRAKQHDDMTIVVVKCI
jgi:sigma-B regulation protein RsbU (phosphoserine phosphatase)